jgi:antagonist of KipI
MLTVIKPGLFTTLQDLGRVGFQKYGVITSGAMDTFAHRIANILVGNHENEATIECTLIGPEIRFENDTLLTLCGGELSANIDGNPVGMWRPILVQAGAVLKFGPPQLGCRVYLAVAGGFQVNSVMESKSTYIRAELGGFKGRTLHSGDRITTGTVSVVSKQIIEYLNSRAKQLSFEQANWSISKKMLPKYREQPYIRVMRGRQFHLFTKESQEMLFGSSFQISAQSDRMGYRLKGPCLKLEARGELLSEAVSFGTIQVPSDGNPIILLADRQTTGGYPKIGQVATVDLPIIAQMAPNEKVEFIEIDHVTAEQLYIEREIMIAQVKNAMLLKIGIGGKSNESRFEL